ncbi:MAG: type II toxin-antitoxin system YafQ family toxin [Gammaproteobacteria bacterium]|nr:type II toxin-antitoxin system YafQ family toxin [Gammaproteobacteria bacterium]
MRKIEPTSAFKRDFKREGKGLHRAVLDTDLKQVITDLANDVPLAAKHRDHTLTGNWKEYRDCHVKPDLILIYRLIDSDGKEDNPARLVLARLGFHSELDL